MKIELESTTKMIDMVVSGGMVPARIWEGKTESGICVHAYITRIAVLETEDLSCFERELLQCRAPSASIKNIPGMQVL